MGRIKAATLQIPTFRTAIQIGPRRAGREKEKVGHDVQDGGCPELEVRGDPVGGYEQVHPPSGSGVAIDGFCLTGTRISGGRKAAPFFSPKCARIEQTALCYRQYDVSPLQPMC